MTELNNYKLNSNVDHDDRELKECILILEKCIFSLEVALENYRLAIEEVEDDR